MKEYQSRREVPKQYQMDLSGFFSSDEEFEKTYQDVRTKISVLEKYQGNLSDPQQLVEFLNQYFEYQSVIENLYVYAYISHDLDLENERYSVMKNQAESLCTELNFITAFFVPEIVLMDEVEYQHLWENSELEKFKFFLDEIYKEKKHTLSENEEKLIELLCETHSSYQNISSSLINSEHDYGVITLDDGTKIHIAANNLRALKRNANANTRKTAHKKFSKKVKQYQDTEAKLLHYFVKNECNLAKLRKFDSAWEKKLHQINMSNEVFENLKSVAKEECGAWQDYYKLVKKILGKKTLYNYDTNVEWSQALKHHYTIEEAENLIQDALSILGKNYQEKLNRVFLCQYIDYCSYKGKVSGGYSFATSTQNSRIVLSFNETYTDILTIAHEAGHNVHHQYVADANEVWYRNTSSFSAEVASLTNEFLLNYYVASHGKTKEEKLQGLEHTLKTFQTNFFGAIMEGEIEQEMYDYVEHGNMITASYLNDCVHKSLKEYQGNVIKNDSYANLMWVTRSHYYMNFYLYSYALCVSIAADVSKRILMKEEGIIEKYETFLRCGANMSLVDVYQTLDINIHEKKVFLNAVLFFQEQMNQYKEILKSGESNE